MKVGKCLGQPQANLDDLVCVDRLAIGSFQVSAQIAGLILDGIKLISLMYIIPQLHDIVIKVALVFVLTSANVQDVDQPRMVPRDRFILENPLKFPLETNFILKILTTHELYRAHCTGNTSCKPHLTIRATTNFA